jgi:hypothetical protein
MATDIREQNKIEAETQAYKMFMRIAKKLKYLEYGKWSIVPDINEPLRKFTIEKDIGWAKIKMCLWAEQYHKRKYEGDWNNAYAYRFKIGMKGLFADNRSELVLKTSMLLKPRMVKKLLTFINERVIPEFYKTIDNERTEYEEKINTLRLLNSNMLKLKGLVELEQNRYVSNEYNGRPPLGTVWKGLYSSNIKCTKDRVNLDLDVDYDKAKKILEVLNG